MTGDRTWKKRRFVACSTQTRLVSRNRLSSELSAVRNEKLKEKRGEEEENAMHSPTPLTHLVEMGCGEVMSQPSSLYRLPRTAIAVAVTVTPPAVRLG